MRPEARDAAYLWDMLEAAREATTILGGLELEVLLADRVRLRAIERTLEIVGESARRVSLEFQSARREVDWRGLIGLRNVLAHDYGRINHRLLVSTATRRLPGLIAVLEAWLEPEAGDRS